MSNFELLDEYQDKSTSNFVLERSQLAGGAPERRDQTAGAHLPKLEFFDPVKQYDEYDKKLDEQLQKEMLADAAKEAGKAKDDGKTKDGGKTQLKDHYDNDSLNDAVKASIDNKVPMVIHIGAPWCIPCGKMEKEVWPGVEKDLKGKAAFVHMNGDAILNKGQGGPDHKTLVENVESFPTIKVVQPSYDKDGKVQFKTISENASAMNDAELREMLKKAKVGTSGDATK